MNIKIIEESLDRLWNRARELPEKESSKLFEEEIFPLVQMQRIFLRQHGGIPQSDNRR